MSATDRTGRPRALITGGARRVGAAIARELARAGCDVTITYDASHAQAGSLVRELVSMGVVADAWRVPLDSLETLRARCEEVRDRHDRWDVLVHNASTYEPSPLEGLSASRVARDYAVNAGAPLLISACLAPMLSVSGLPAGGAIVAITDVHAQGRPRRDHASYAMSKAALGEMVRSLARDLAPRVRVNGIAPGVILWPEAGPDSDAGAQRAYVSRVPLGRAGTPEEAARAVRWLALEAGYVTGQILGLDGGRSLA